MSSIIELPDGYNGHTEKWYSIPVTRSGNEVRLQCASPRWNYMFRWFFAPLDYHGNDPLIQQVLKSEQLNQSIL